MQITLNQHRKKVKENDREALVTHHNDWYECKPLVEKPQRGRQTESKMYVCVVVTELIV